jgi:hypothetical protein
VHDDIEGFLDYSEVRNHCNGLLLLEEDVVANPATQERASLPPRPLLYMGKEYFTCGSFLVFDPAVSPHYEVVSIPKYQHYDRPAPASNKSVEWPSSPFRLHVFSSRTGRWEETPFLLKGDPTVPGIPVPCSLGLSATSQQYFSLRTNQPPATSQQYFCLRINQHQHQPPAKRTCYLGFRLTNRIMFIGKEKYTPTGKLIPS